MAFRKTNVTLETLTLALAREFAEMHGLPGERPLRESRLAFLDKERREGRFVSPTWAVVVEEGAGQRYRLNGQHSSTMLARLAPEDFPGDLLVTIEEFTSNDLARDTFRLFNLFDNPKSLRSNTDLMGFFRASYPDLADIDLGTLVNLCNGVNHYESKRADGVEFVPRERGAHLHRPQVREFVKWAAQYAEEEHGWMFGKAGIVAEMYLDIEADPGNAKQFWAWALCETHQDKDHESRELTRRLKDLAPKPKVGQDRLQKEAAKYWKVFRRTLVAQMPLVTA